VTADQVKNSRAEFKKAVDALAPFKRYMDVYTSQWFGNAVRTTGKGKGRTDVSPALEFLRSGDSEEWAKASNKFKLPTEWKGVAATALAAADEKRFFHWELEYPEIFYGHRPGTTQALERLDGAGFDAVIGNPPYDVLVSDEIGYDVSPDLAFYNSAETYAPAMRGASNLYKLFICRGASVTKTKGAFSFIVPMSLLGDDQSVDMRRYLLNKMALTVIEAFPQKDEPDNRVFQEAKLSTVIFVAKATSDKARFLVRTHPGKLIEKSSLSLAISPEEIVKFDAANLLIPSCTPRDWEIAVSLLSRKIIRLGKVARCFRGDMEQTKEIRAGTLGPSKKGPLVLRGANITLYAVREASQGEDLFLDVDKFMKQAGDKTKASLNYGKRKIGYQRSSPQNNFRRIIAAPVPKNDFCFDTVSYVTEDSSKIDLNLLLVLLNSKILDWYFRLGSTNSKVNEYQFNTLPVPTFSDKDPSVDWQSLVKAGQWVKAGDLLRSVCNEPGVVPKPVQESLVEMCRQIQKIETARVLKNRSERSQLAPESQPIQDAIDKVLFRCYGLSDEEAGYINKRLEEML